jgi:hypothetical protein
MIVELLRRNVRPRDILTRAALENAIAASSGSTNAVLHLLALARLAFETRGEQSQEDLSARLARAIHGRHRFPRRVQSAGCRARRGPAAGFGQAR